MPLLPAGQVGFVPGFALSKWDTVESRSTGGAVPRGNPHRTVDPVLLAARTVGALTPSSSRENFNAQDPAVVKRRIVTRHQEQHHPEEVKLQIPPSASYRRSAEALLAAIAASRRGGGGGRVLRASPPSSVTR